MISATLENKDIAEFKDNDFYPKVKKYIELHPLSYHNCGVRKAFYAVALFGEYAMHILDNYMEMQADRPRGVVDAVWMKTRYAELCGLAGTSLMEEFS